MYELSSNDRLWAVVPASGVGKRMGGTHPKQYLSLLDQTVIDHTLSRLLAFEPIEHIYVALSVNDHYWPTTQQSKHQRISTVVGGAERADSVLNGLIAVTQNPLANDQDWVMVHDAARPCVRADDLHLLLKTVVESSSIGGILALPVRDTMKRGNAAGEIVTTVDRSHLWAALTPQLFRLGSLRNTLSRALREGATVTDEASAIEWAGDQPLLVEGHEDNIKITRPRDLKLAEIYLREQLAEKGALCG